MAGGFIYPFTAIVGQELMRTALLLHAIDPALGGVLIRGERGTAKSTAVRALAALLPEIDAMPGCDFACDPCDPVHACEACSARLASESRIEALRRPVPVVDLPIGATEDRVLGSLDLEAAIQSGERRFEPGLLARANRGILYVDEVNLLGDHLVDILLDAAAMGRNYVEREGVSFSHPASFMLVGTMNPEEGDLRPQLLDRFALAVEVQGLRDPAARAEVVRGRIAFEADPCSFIAARQPGEEAERQRLAHARALLPSVQVPSEMLDLIVRICAAFEVDGMRADLAIYRAARCLAAYSLRTAVDATDVRTASTLALPHRRRRQPFEESGLDAQRLDEVMREALNETAPAGVGGGAGSEEPPRAPVDATVSPTPSTDAQPPRALAGNPDPEGGAEGNRLQSHSAGNTQAGASPASPGRIATPGAVPHLVLPSPARPRRRNVEGPGRRASTAAGSTGAPADVAPPCGEVRELALAATLRAAAPHQPARRSSGAGPVLRLRPEDLRERRRRGRTSSLVLFVVDASGSMGARDRMAATKSTVLGLLLDAYRKRDRVGLIAFRDRTAELILPPTNSVDLAERSLRFLPTGGRTPLAAGLALAAATLERAQRSPAALGPLLVLVSDGRANSALEGQSPWRAALAEAERVRKKGWPVLLLDSERGATGTGLTRALAAALCATHIPLECLHLVAFGRQRPNGGLS